MLQVNQGMGIQFQLELYQHKNFDWENNTYEYLLSCDLRAARCQLPELNMIQMPGKLQVLLSAIREK